MDMKLPQFLRIDKRDILIALTTLISLALFVPIFTYFYFAHDLDSKDKIMNLKNTGVVLLDSSGSPFFSFYQGKYKTFVSISEIPRITQEAAIASEDKDFYHHGGFSIPSIIRSAFTDLEKTSLAYGGSTITQQLVKNSLLYTNKNLLRKYQEIVLASEIERRYSKQEILEMYLNSVYFGEGAFGIEEASQTYFGKDAKDLTAAESAYLIGLLPAPSRYSPFTGDAEAAKLREQIVLQKMVEQGYLTPSQAKQSEAEIMVFLKGDQSTANSLAPHFALMVLDQLKQKYGEETVARSGFKVTTTLNSDWQRYAQEVVANQVKNLAPDNVSNGAAVVEDPKTGEIKALVGSKDWFNNQYGKVNVATSLRQPGSSFKPIVYSSALEERLITPATILQDTQQTFNQCQGDINPHAPGCDYSPQDFDNSFWGPLSVRLALANSRNVPAVEVIQKVGVGPTLEMARRLGISSLGDSSKYGLSLVLGAGEVQLLQLTNVYATFANQGSFNTPTLITKIDDKFGTEIYSYTPQPQPVLDPGVAYQISSILSDNSARAREFGNSLTISRVAAVKTGTTSDFKDSLTLGYTPSLAVGVWVGNNDGQPMNQIAGSLGAAPIWRSLMEKFLSGTPVEAFKPPPDILAEANCISGSKEATSSARIEYYLSGTVPIGCSAPSLSATLAQSSPASSDNQPTIASTEPGDCTGPDGKHLKLSQGDCRAFNHAWGH